MNKVKRCGLLVLGLVVLGAISVLNAKEGVDFDGGGACSQIRRAVVSADGFLPTEDSIPLPVDARRLVNLDNTDRRRIAESLNNSTKEKELLLDKKIVVFFNAEKVVFAESSDKERYNVSFLSQDPLLLSQLKKMAGSRESQNRGWIKVCVEVVKWAIFIKDGVETGEWICETVCGMQWEAGPGEGGHIAPGSDTHVRTRPVF
ncbi:MAG: hypothetical protein A2049_00380 [Elusimicrobia bacterium GWA2_62_23]|nr:MAG: hypothetical protein A2049_00380 [Elusimicrobia bacterium GWA2_62_23]